MLRKILRSVLCALAVFAFWFAIWFILSRAVAKELLLPSPIAVFGRLWELLGEREFYIITGSSLLRVIKGILFASVLGIVLAVITHFSRVFDALIKPLITVIKATPVASFIILALVWIKRGDLPIFISLLIVLPVVWTNLREGLAQVDSAWLEMAKVFKIKPLHILSGIYIPSVLPYFSSAAKASMGLAWKAGIAAEVLAVPADSIGKKLFESKNHLETVDVFAWTVVVIMLSLIIELCFEKILHRLTNRQRRG